MTTDIITVQNVHGYIDEAQVAWLNAEDVARGLGFVDTHQKKVFATSGEKYENIRWARVNGYLAEFDYPPVKSGDFIPEHVFYLLAMKANNEVAKNFQLKIATEILPTLRKQGYVALQDNNYKPLKTLDTVKEEIALVESTENDTTLKLQEVEKATAALIKANFALKMAKQDYSLALSNYKEAAAIAGVKPKDFKVESPTFTVRYLYEKYKDQGVTISALYDAAIAAGVPAKGVFDRGRLEVPQDHLESVLSSLSLVADQSLSYLKRIEQGLISQDTTLGTLISLLKEEGYTTVDQDSVTAAGLLRVMKKHKLSFKESSHRKGDTIMSSTIPPQTVIDLLSLAN